jgi:hypothetical protein
MFMIVQNMSHSAGELELTQLGEEMCWTGSWDAHISPNCNVIWVSSRVVMGMM